MKKKVLAFFIAAALACFACSAVVAADVSGLIERSFDESVFDGQWWSFPDGFTMYLPVGWEDVTEVFNLPGVIFFLSQSEDGNTAIAIAKSETGLGEEATLEDVAEKLGESGTYTIEEDLYLVNDIGCAGFYVENGSAGYAFLDEEGFYYVVAVGPVTEENRETVEGILNSLSGTVSEDETEG